MTRPPATGTAITARPSVFAAGETARAESAWKKTRLAKKRIRCSRAQAAPVLAAPIGSASAAMRSRRRSELKSRRPGAALVARRRVIGW